ncbi:MAG: shikimate kinase, partial [Fimbriimonadales bacterium]|nr:shikimate kinase [Fimbriimonadales bacterium]
MKHLYLIGSMGSGKTTVGRLLAERLGLPLYDVDALVEQAAGATISEIFERFGEARFRELESATLEEVACRPAGVVATGGGAVLCERNRARMRQTGWLVYLKASLETLWGRLRRSANRPLLRTATPRETLKSILEAREPLYEEADWVVEVDTLTPAQVANILQRVYHPVPDTPLTIPVLAGQPHGYEVKIAPELSMHAATCLLEQIHPTRVALLTHRRLLRWAEPLRDALARRGV